MSTDAKPAPWSPPSPLPARFETARLQLRFHVPEDASSMLEALNVDRSSFIPYLPWVRTDNRTLAEVIFNIERFRRFRERADPPPDDFMVGIFDRATGEVVGGTGYHRVIHAAHEAEIGYWVRPDRRRMGLCTEAVAGILSWGFRSHGQGGWGFRRMHIRCAARNAASRRVPEKLGLRLEAEFKADRWLDGVGWESSLAWGVLVDEWDCAASRLRPGQS